MNDSNDFQPIEQHVIGRDQHNGQNASATPQFGTSSEDFTSQRITGVQDNGARTIINTAR